MTTSIDFAAIAAEVYFGEPTARKSGRNPKWPYVPVVAWNVRPGGPFVPRTQVVIGRAYATRDEAVAYAAAYIAHQRASLAKRLAEPRNRAEREQYGLPRELV